MESNEQTELRSETDRFRWRADDSYLGEGLGVEGLSKKEKELMDMENSVVIAEGREV